MKLKKKAKRRIIMFLVIVLLVILGILLWKQLSNTEPQVKETKIVSKIDKYGYKLKDNKPTTYKKLFKELETILNEKTVDEEKYVSKISEMFIYDFYSLDDKTAKTDIGGVDFVYPAARENFLKNAQNTYYKYVENNIYGNRNQKLPIADKMEVVSVEKTPFAYGEQTDEEAYKVTIKWDYTDTAFSSYQKNAVLIFIHNGIILELVELQ